MFRPILVVLIHGGMEWHLNDARVPACEALWEVVPMEVGGPSSALVVWGNGGKKGRSTVAVITRQLSR